jgi:hypothetical protein
VVVQVVTWVELEMEVPTVMVILVDVVVEEE